MRGLYAITPPDLSTPDLIAKVRAALQGGVTMLQYRDKSADSRKRLHEAQALRQLCHDFAAWFVVNDDIDLAHAVEADAVHIGRDDRRPEDDTLAFG
ncbi:MAG: thiamine phosphate synthase, partial [Burkholderiales bacterium]|nr:thiamine phosphate synthase [Burkholderiales bacterium]